jgi:hypothetical protein
LTLGALAELESAFGVDNLNELAERFENGRLSARDIIRIVGAGLRGAGNRVSDEDVAEMSTEAGVAGFAAIAAELAMGDLWRRRAGTGGQTQSRPGGIPSGGRRKPSRAAGGGAVTKQERALFPWASAIRFGLGRLRLSPRTFWALSLPSLSR